MKERNQNSPTIKSFFIKIPMIIWAPLTCGLLILIIGGLALTFQMPLLFSSLGAIAYSQIYSPYRNNRTLPRKIIGGIVAVIVGYGSVLITTAYKDPDMSQIGYPSNSYMWASIIGVIICLFLQIVLKSFESSGGATVLIITLGIFKLEFIQITGLVIGILLTTIAGDRINRLRSG